MNKQEILDLYNKHRTSSLSESDQKVLDSYSTYNDPELPYHNATHARSVLAVFEVLRKLSKETFTKDQLHQARTAILYHDINHQGRPDLVKDEDGLTNVERAMKVFAETCSFDDLDEARSISRLIEMTEYPHTPPTQLEPESELIALIRDADILWGLFPENYQVTLLGIWLEQTQSGYLPQEPCDIEILLVDQIKFIQHYKPYTRAGSILKQALFTQASEGWAEVALEFLRQLEAAKTVEQMSDEEVLKLRDAIKTSVRQTTH